MCPVAAYSSDGHDETLSIVEPKAVTLEKEKSHILETPGPLCIMEVESDGGEIAVEVVCTPDDASNNWVILV